MQKAGGRNTWVSLRNKRGGCVARIDFERGRMTGETRGPF